MKKNTNHLTVRGGGGGNPYGHPDRKISVFFFDGFPYSLSDNLKAREASASKNY